MISLRISPHYSFKTLRLASVLLVCGLSLLGRDAFAAGEFTVDNVTVDASGDNATDARAKALAEGEMSAFRQLIARRNIPDSGHIISMTGTAQVSAMIRGFQIGQEKITDNHYHATLQYSFEPAAIEALGAPAAAPAATNAQAPAAPAPAAASSPAAAAPASKAVLVLPVYDEGSARQLWQDDNKWRNIWFEAALESGGGIVVVPLGDLDDRVDVDDSNVITASSASLSRMYGRYGVGEIDVMSAFYDLKADPKPALEVTLTQLKAGDKEAHSAHMSYTIRSTETPDALMVRAANDIARLLLKQQTTNPNKVEYERLKEITARIRTSDIHEWEALRQRLLARSNIAGVRLTSVSYYETSMVITFKGTPDMLGKTLVASGLRVMQDGDSLVLALP